MSYYSNTIQELTDYFEELAVKHKQIRHSAEENHYIRLCADEQLSARRSIVPPVVSFDKLVADYQGTTDAVKKSRSVELMFLDNVKDVHDYDEISAVWEKMEQLADDFLMKILQDRTNRVDYPFLRYVDVSSARLEYVESVGNFWGVLLSLRITAPALNCSNIDEYLKDRFN